MGNTILRINTPPAIRPARFFSPLAISHMPYAILVATLLVVSTASFVRAQQPVRLALLPFENVSGSVKGPTIIMPMIEQNLVKKGYRMLNQEKLEEFLSRNRIRNTGMISRAQLRALRTELAVQLAMVGSVDLFHASQEPDDNPQWGLSSRVLSAKSETILWAESVGLTGQDFRGLLGLGAITSGEQLAKEVVTVLLRNLPGAADTFKVRERTTRGPLRARSVRPTYRSPSLDAQPPRRIAVLPFNNASERRGASRILTDILTTALFHHGRFEVIEPGEVNEALIALKTATYGSIDLENLHALRNRTGVDAVFVGTIYTYNEGLKPMATTPGVELDVSMLSATSGRILWAAIHGRTGNDYQIVLDFGVISSMVPLILQVVGEMLQTL